MSDPIRFESYEVHPIADNGTECYVCADEDAHFWSVYGLLPSFGGGRDVAVCIGDFQTREAAELVVEFISGSR